MEITTHDFFTALHGMGFGALFMLAFSGALAELYRISALGAPTQMSMRGQQDLPLVSGRSAGRSRRPRGISASVVVVERENIAMA
jgi:hypothetical protein